MPTGCRIRAARRLSWLATRLPCHIALSPTSRGLSFLRTLRGPALRFGFWCLGLTGSPSPCQREWPYYLFKRDRDFSLSVYLGWHVLPDQPRSVKADRSSPFLPFDKCYVPSTLPPYSRRHLYDVLRLWTSRRWSTPRHQHHGLFHPGYHGSRSLFRGYLST